jgi:hypothetical protein
VIEVGVILCLLYAWYAHSKWAAAKAEEIKDLKESVQVHKGFLDRAIAIADDSQRSTKEYLRSKGL